MNIHYQINIRVNTEIMKEILDELQIEYRDSKYGDFVCKSYCHGGSSYKVYFHDNSDSDSYSAFYCFSGCGQLSIFDYIKKAMNWDYAETVTYFNDKLKINAINAEPIHGIFIYDEEIELDYSKHRLVEKIRKNSIIEELPAYDEKILSVFPKYYPYLWYQDNISIDALDKFNIRMKPWDNAIVIPHYDKNNRLIGIRVRNLDEDVVERGHKYMPLRLNNKYYSHPLNKNLYGINNNLEYIKKYKKILLVEGEKSVLQCETYFPDNNFSLAIGGRSLSQYQIRELVYECGVEEVIIGLDNEYKDDMTLKQKQKYKLHKKKIKKIFDNLKGYCDVYNVGNYKDILDYQDSPTDKGKDVLLKLMANKIKLDERSVNEL